MTNSTRSEQIADSTARQVMLALDPGDTNGSATIFEFAALNPDGTIYWRAFADRDAAKRVVDAHPGTRIGSRKLTVKIKVGEWTPEKPEPKFKAGDRVTIHGTIANGFWEGKTGTVQGTRQDRSSYDWDVLVDNNPMAGSTPFLTSELELEPAAKFKVGDRVTISSDAAKGFWTGKSGTILAHNPDSTWQYKVRVDGYKTPRAFNPEELTHELATREFKTGDKVSYLSWLDKPVTGILESPHYDRKGNWMVRVDSVSHRVNESELTLVEPAPGSKFEVGSIVETVYQGASYYGKIKRVPTTSEYYAVELRSNGETFEVYRTESEIWKP